jgi:hypothetical protein
MESAAIFKVHQSLVYVCKGESRRGLAVFVDQQHLLTCAHVVAKSLGLDFNAPASQCENRLIVCEILTNGARQTFETTVLVHRPALGPGEGTPEEQALSDVAVLRIQDGKQLPIVPIAVRFWNHRINDKVVVCGAVTNENGNLDVSTGTAVKEVDDGRIYIKIDQQSGARPGYSGGPVEHLDDSQMVFGLVQRAPDRGGDAKFIPANLIRDALAGQFVLEVAARGEISRRNAEGVDSGEFFAALLIAKNRHDQERQLLDVIGASQDAATRTFRVAVALLPTPAESCPDVFRNRLTKDRFASQRNDWGGRPTWVLDWAPPIFRLDGAPRSSFESQLKTLLHEKLGDSLPQNSTLRTQLARRLALIPLSVRIDAWSIGRGITELADEVRRWVEAHATAQQLPFCLLLFLETEQRRRFFRQFMPLPDLAQIEQHLRTIPGLAVSLLDPLRPLRASRDLDDWIDRTSLAIRKRGHEPMLIKGRVLEKTYGGRENDDVTFFQWQRRLDQRLKEIFAEH